MMKNGEFQEYHRYGIANEIESEWAKEVKERLLNEICSNDSILNIVPLSYVELPEAEIIDAFKELAVSSQKVKIRTAIHQMKPLFDPILYNRIISLFED